MKYRLVCFLILVTLSFNACRASSGAATVAAQGQASVAERIQRVENGLLPGVMIKGQSATMKLAERLAHYKVLGLSVAVINDGKIEWARGYGVVEKDGGKPVTPDTLFLAGSISKLVAALAALRLVEQGKLDLDEDVNLKLKTWKAPENEFTKAKKVTLRGLLSHSAGLTVHGFPGYEVPDYLPPERILAKVDPAVYQKYAGLYEYEGFKITMTADDGRLKGAGTRATQIRAIARVGNIIHLQHQHCVPLRVRRRRDSGRRDH